MIVADEYVSNLRVLMSYGALNGGYARFSISAGDLAIREESLDTMRCALRITFRTRLSAIDSALTGTQLVSTTMVSHASALPTRASILDVNKKQLAPLLKQKLFRTRITPRMRETPRQRLRYHSCWGAVPECLSALIYVWVLFSLYGTIPVVNSTVMSEEAILRREYVQRLQ